MRRVAQLVLQREKENDEPRCRGRRQRARLGARSAELSFRPTRIACGRETNIGEARHDAGYIAADV